MGRGPVVLVLIGLDLVWCIAFRNDWSLGAPLCYHIKTWLYLPSNLPPPAPLHPFFSLVVLRLEFYSILYLILWNGLFTADFSQICSTAVKIYFFSFRLGTCHQFQVFQGLSCPYFLRYRRFTFWWY